MHVRRRRRPRGRPRRCAASSCGPSRSTIPTTLWVHELIGAAVSTADGTRRRRGRRVQANPASDLLVLDTGALVPLPFVVERRDDGRRRDRSARRASSTSASTPIDADAHRRLHDLPGDGRRLRRAEPARQGAASAGCSTSGSTTCASAATDPHRSVDDAPFGGGAGHGADARAAVRARSRRSTRRGRCSCSGPGGRRFDQAMARELAAARRVLAAVRPLRGRRRAGPRAPRRRRAVDRRLRARPAARWRPWSCSRRSAGWCPA